jgi:hypothetical protein
MDGQESIKSNTLQVEIGTQMLIKIEGVERSFRTNLVGQELGHYLIVQAPKAAGIEGKLNKDRPVNVTYLLSGRIYGFQTTIQSYISTPSALIFLSYPKAIRCRDLREQQRVECFIPSMIKTHSREYRGMILDISLTGCRFSLKILDYPDSRSLEAGEPLDLVLAIPGLDRNALCAGQIKNAVIDGYKLFIGVKFIGLSKETAAILGQYINFIIDFKEH